MRAAIPDSMAPEIEQLLEMFGAATGQIVALTDQEGRPLDRMAAGNPWYMEWLGRSGMPEASGAARSRVSAGTAWMAEWTPGLKYVVSPLKTGDGRSYFLWSGFYMEEGSKHQVLHALEHLMKDKAWYGEFRMELDALPECSGRGIAQACDKLAFLSRTLVKLLEEPDFCSADPGIELDGGITPKVKEAVSLLPEADTLQELGEMLLETVAGEPFAPLSAFVWFPEHTPVDGRYLARGLEPEECHFYVQDLASRYSPQAFLSTAIIHEAPHGQMLECPLLLKSQFKGVLAAGFTRREEAERWMEGLETVAAAASAAIRFLEQEALAVKQSEVTLKNLLFYLQGNHYALYALSQEAACMAYEFARFLELPELEAEALRTAGRMAPFRLGFLQEYGFYPYEVSLLEQLDRYYAEGQADQAPALPSSVQLLGLTLRKASEAAPPELFEGPPKRWIDPARFRLNEHMAESLDGGLRDAFCAFLRTRTDTQLPLRSQGAGRLAVGSLPRSPKEEWGITPREEEVLELIVQGKTNKEIAGTLVISEHTVKNHLSRIFNKMNVTDRSQIIALIYKRMLESERIEL
ncbi:LuxR C-terminal-related transcriptional regulator [Paenibacillus sp. NFR01]|uniref:helix-turn-helix transcriptional regulator n=1 Tax=Paenibacillus sp. NFR01 TaxID=1566279 RepID=UPI0008BADE35|nr:LuxR C-terminal-related transcriptional regulator [Paenibacillus sp. NFR01]SEU29118.1 regulatory protein, luxR family [Paenibacillus sp. NFR01]